MTAPGRDRGHPLRRAHGELAFLGACAAVARLDFEHAEAVRWREAARKLAAQLPPGAVMLEPVPLQALVDRLAAFEVAVEAMHRLPSGERDYVRPVRAQGELREALTNAMASLYHQALPVWARGEPAPWEAFAAEAEEMDEGAR